MYGQKRVKNGRPFLTISALDQQSDQRFLASYLFELDLLTLRKNRKILVPGLTRLPSRPEPFIVIDPGKGPLSRELFQIWQFRDLLSILAARDVRVRYKQTALGILWVFIQPLATVAVYTFLFSTIAKVPSDGVPYPLFAIVGLLPWSFLANTINTSGNSLVGNASLITKVFFPRMIIPISSVLAGVVDFAIALTLLVPLMIYYETPATMHLLGLPVLVFLTILLAIAVGLIASALNVKYRDVRSALPFLTHLLLFASPVVYPLSVIPERWRSIFLLNPVTGLVEGYRSAILGTPWHLTSLSASIAVIFLLLAIGVYNFRSMEHSFADVV
jgi:lipopolysaccharide transport system permease protein